jgi:hypothetical protein
MKLFPYNYEIWGPCKDQVTLDKVYHGPASFEICVFAPDMDIACSLSYLYLYDLAPNQPCMQRMNDIQEPSHFIIEFEDSLEMGSERFLEKLREIPSFPCDEIHSKEFDHYKLYSAVCEKASFQVFIYTTDAEIANTISIEYGKKKNVFNSVVDSISMEISQIEEPILFGKSRMIPVKTELIK